MPGFQGRPAGGATNSNLGDIAQTGQLGDQSEPLARSALRTRSGSSAGKEEARSRVGRCIGKTAQPDHYWRPGGTKAKDRPACLPERQSQALVGGAELGKVGVLVADVAPGVADRLVRQAAESRVPIGCRWER